MCHCHQSTRVRGDKFTAMITRRLLTSEDEDIVYAARNGGETCVRQFGPYPLWALQT
jgi:hypothetical protein